MYKEGIVKSIKLNGSSVRSDNPLLQKCSYLFYELNDEDQDGGYKVELSFEDS